MRIKTHTSMSECTSICRSWALQVVVTGESRRNMQTNFKQQALAVPPISFLVRSLLIANAPILLPNHDSDSKLEIQIRGTILPLDLLS